MRALLSLLVILVAVAFVACSDDGTTTTDGPIISDGPIQPDIGPNEGGVPPPDGPPAPDTGTAAALQTVVDSLTLPTSASQYAVDLDGNGSPDNQLGKIIGALKTAGFDNQAEIDAQWTLDSSVLEGNVTGDALERQLERVETLQNVDRYRVSTQVSIEFLDFEIAVDGTHAQVETLEVWRGEVYRLDEDVMQYRNLPDYTPQTYSLEMVDGRWLVEDIEFHYDPDHFPLAEGLDIVYELVEQRDRADDVEATAIIVLVENNGGTNLATPFVFASFYDEDDKILVHQRAWCSANPLEAGARALCRYTLTSDRENYPTDWQRYELKPVGTPSADEPVTLTAVEVNLLEDPQGNPYITGWVRNDDGQNAYVYGNPIFYDEQGHPLERSYAIVAVEGGVLGPGDTAAFQVVFLQGWEGSTYDLLWNGDVTGESPRTGLVTEYVVQEAGQIKGHLRNTSDDVEQSILVFGLFYDASDQLIGIRTNEEFLTLSPGESEGFTINFPSQVAEEDMARYELIVK